VRVRGVRSAVDAADPRRLHPRRGPLRAAPAGIATLVAGAKVAGRALLPRHYGSVDVFLEAFEAAPHSDVRIVDNAGRGDVACIGDLAVLEAAGAELAGIGCLGSPPRQRRALWDPVWVWLSGRVVPSR